MIRSEYGQNALSEILKDLINTVFFKTQIEQRSCLAVVWKVIMTELGMGPSG